jgi:hypothetical protein
MSTVWSIGIEWEPLDSGPPEERACFSAISIQARGTYLTEGRDALANRLRKAPLLSAYHLAEWMAWNWWRLRWESRSNEEDWALSHRLTSIGGGYIWPNITIFSDGERTALIAKPTDERPQTPFRYIADVAVVIQAFEFEAGLDSFIDQVLQRLESEKIGNTNLQAIWKGVWEERRTPELAKARKLEALLSLEPDELDSATLTRLLADAEQLSMAAVEEIAAGHGPRGKVLTAEDLRAIAAENGFDTSPRDTVHLAPGTGLPLIGEIPAWRRGADAARALRQQRGLGGKPISNEQLVAMAGTQSAVLSDRKGAADISFALDDNPQHGRIVLRSKWETGRRFELARLLGDRIAAPEGGRLFPATRAYTYRQKMQRSFAAELLSPFEVVDEMLDGDYSMENQLEVAQHFRVSEWTIRTQLVNHSRLQREDLEGELEPAAPSL